MCCVKSLYERIVTIIMTLVIGVAVIKQAVTNHILLHILLSEYVIIYGRVGKRTNEFSIFLYMSVYKVTLKKT